MKNSSKAIITAALFIAFIAVTTFVYNKLSKQTLDGNSVAMNNSSIASSSIPESEELKKMPDFTVVDSLGNNVKLSDLYGKPIVLNFWASWCPPCKEEMPDFNKVYEEFGTEINFVMVDLVDGNRETLEKGKAHIEDQGFTFPVYYDTAQEAAYLYGITSIPTTIFIDAEGYGISGVKGAISEQKLREYIELIK